MDPPAPKFDEQQDVERLEPGSLDGEEVARDDPLRLSSDELGPSGSGPPRGGTESRGSEQVANGRGRYPDPELGEFALDPDAAPAWVLLRDPQDEFANLWVDRRPSRPTDLAVRPLRSHELPVPTQECGRGDQKAGPSLTRDRPAGHGK